VLTTVDSITMSFASAAACIALGWIGLALTARLLGRLPGAVGSLSHRVADRITPQFVRSALAAVISIGIGAAPAGATEEPLPLLDRVSTAQQSGRTPSAVPAPTPSATSTTTPAADPAPEPATAPADDTAGDPAAGPASRPTAASIHEVPGPYVVRRGDTLWAIAARHLPPTATVVDVDRSWREWWRANRGVIGSDPNLIRPGQELAQPEKAVQQ
jgi:nucleoid-associated protein YgaU